MRTSKAPTDPLRSALDALGVDAPLIDTPESVHRALVAYWRQHKRHPQIRELARELGMTRNQVDHALARLHATDRVLHPRIGVWVPVVDDE